MPTDAERIAELGAIIQAVRERVRARYPEPGAGERSAASFAPADLMPIVHARDAAQAKIAAIGSVNPRAGGPINQIIQFVKRTVARSLQWFVRDQITFNREVVTAIEAVLEALNDHNRALAEIGSLHLEDVRRHWIEWRTEWERKLTATETQYLRNVADLHLAFQHRATMLESEFRDIAKRQHEDFTVSLDKARMEIMNRLAMDFQTVRAEYDRLIHDELRTIRLRSSTAPVHATVSAPASQHIVQSVALDYTRFADRFRGPEEVVRRNLEIYKPYFADRQNVLDIGCGRGEFLEMMREQGVPARGIDLGEESIAQCRLKNLDVEQADLFAYLAKQPEGEFDGIFSSQVIEHLEPARLPAMIRLGAAALRRGGILAIETPNPECLAIFATYFYIDPTHTRPVPYSLVEFYMQESGLGGIEVRKLSPAVESLPEVAELPEHFRDRFFGGLDYAIIGRKL